eukprot:16434916-Heterocapsa_arctica.AAC.1
MGPGPPKDRPYGPTGVGAGQLAGPLARWPAGPLARWLIDGLPGGHADAAGGAGQRVPQGA